MSALGVLDLRVPRVLPSEPEEPSDPAVFCDDRPLDPDPSVEFSDTFDDLFAELLDVRRDDVLADVGDDFLPSAPELSFFRPADGALPFPFLALDCLPDPLSVFSPEPLLDLAFDFLEAADVLGARAVDASLVSRETLSAGSTFPFGPDVLSTPCSSDSPAGELGMSDPKPRPSPRLFSATVLLLHMLGTDSSL